MRVLITGAAGIIGTVLTKGLRDRYELHRRPARTACAVLFTPALVQHHQAIRRDSFRKVKELIERIERYTAKWNANAHPFMWTATADSILQKVKRLCECISATGH